MYHTTPWASRKAGPTYGLVVSAQGRLLFGFPDDDLELLPRAPDLALDAFGEPERPCVIFFDDFEEPERPLDPT
jgi:hypothetical protein